MAKKNHFKRAVEYIKQNLEQYEIEHGWHCIGMRQPIPCEISDKISDMLEEYGEDNGLPEGWHMEYGDIEDFFMEIES